MNRLSALAVVCAVLWLQPTQGQVPVAQPKPVILVLPFAPGEGLGEQERYLGVALQDLLENSLLEIPELDTRALSVSIKDRFADRDRWNAFVLGQGPAPDYRDVACTVTGRVNRRADAFILDIAIRGKDGTAKQAALTADFPALIEMRRAFGA